MDTNFLGFLSNPATVALLTALVLYFGNKAINASTARKAGSEADKTQVEGVILSVDKIVELSTTIYTLRNSLNDTELEKSKLKLAFDNYKEGCEEIKNAARDFITASDAIYKKAGDSIIVEQAESLKRKLNK